MQRGDTIIGKYRLVRELGSGGMGVVWEAWHVVTDRPFAIKFLHGPTRDEHYERFLQEARVSGLVRHPNIVDVYDVGSAAELGNLPFLVMDLLDGLAVGDILAMAGRLSVEQALALMIPLVSAVAAAHDAGVVHRDLKPSNLFVHRQATGALVPKVLDFGISKLLGHAKRPGDSGAEARRRLTRTGAVLGSPLYMSPEQLRGDPTLDARSDVHALGAILWECLAGQSLWSHELDDSELAAQIANGARRPLLEVRPECPPELGSVVARAVAVRREDRFASAHDLQAELERLRTALAAEVSLSEPKLVAALFPMLTAPKMTRGFEHATTVDSDMAPPMPTASVAGGPRSARSSQSIAGWADKPITSEGTSEGTSRRGLYVALAVGTVALVAVLGIARERTAVHAVHTGVEGPLPSVVLPPPKVTPPAPAASPAVAVPDPAAAAVPSGNAAVRVAEPHATPHAAAATARAKAPSDRDATAPEPIGTSANGAPIVR